MINVRQLERLHEKQRDADWSEATNPLVGQMRNALPAFLNVVRALHAWDRAMGDFQQEQAERERRGEVISMDWSLKRCGEVQDKLDEAVTLLRLQFSFEDK